MTKILSDDEVLADFRAKESPYKDHGEPVIENPYDVTHEFEIRGVKWTCGARDGGEVELSSEAADLANGFGDGSYTSAERDQLQAGVDATIEKLRAKLGHRVAVFHWPIPRDWPP